MLTAQKNSGFTLVEVIVALVLLSVAVLGIGVTASRMSTSVAQAEWAALATEAAEDRLSEIRTDPRYAALDSVYGGTESGTIGTGSYRVTTVNHVETTNPTVDYKIFSVVVTAPAFNTSVSRRIVIAAP